MAHLKEYYFIKWLMNRGAFFQKTNPELAAEQMQDLEMDRTLERATLKHTKANKNAKLAFMQQVTQELN